MHVRHINPHRANVGTDIAMFAFLCFHRDMIKAYLVKRPKQRTHGAEISAPASFNDEDKNDEQNEDHERKGEEKIRNEFPRVQEQNRDGSCQKTYRADICEDEPNKI